MLSKATRLQSKRKKKPLGQFITLALSSALAQSEIWFLLHSLLPVPLSTLRGAEVTQPCTVIVNLQALTPRC